MSQSTLTFVSTESIRNGLLVRNLQPYSVPGVYTPPVSQVAYEITQSNYSVINSPDELVSSNPFANQLYPLNQFGPEGGFNLDITFNGPLLPLDPNQGPYYPVINSPLVLSSGFYLNQSNSSPNIQNTFRPVDGYIDLYSTEDIQNSYKIFAPYWDPPNFIPSIYSPYEIFLSNNPTGSDGTLSQDSFIAKLGAEQLKFLFQERVNLEIYQNTIGLVNLDSLQDPFEASLLVTGQQPLIFRNWKITVPENPILRAVDLATRLAGAYWPVSPIPGDYFDENEINGAPSQQTSNALNVVNQLTGGFLGPILNITRNPSEIFLANTGNAQRSALFRNIDYNRYQPAYKQTLGGLLGIAQGLTQAISSLINPDNGTLQGGYYVGSRNAEPGQITSPPNQVPVDPFGRQVQTPVYGPSELGSLYEGNIGRLNFGLAGKSSSDGGGIDGQFVWVSPKYKNDAGFKATPGGGTGSQDEEFNLISSQYSSNQSTNLQFKESSILDATQRLVNSADLVNGASRLKHVGNAINQVSKVFNDGYKEITKGSKVLSYVNNATGREDGIEYARVFTKDTPYYTYNDLQKKDGITTQGRRFTNSVLDNTFNLNIAPMRGPDSTNLKVKDGKRSVKKYMFSIENLAWRTASRPGYRVDDLPDCEKGPNGGRIMWFPPYDLKFNDTSSPSFQSTSFLGRPEPMYTYKDTSRSGTLSWKIIVDHPSILNVIVRKQLKGARKEKIDSILESFFAGAMKYDIYELTKRFGTIPSNVIQAIQEALQNTTNSDDASTLLSEIPSGADGNSNSAVNNNTKLESLKNEYLNVGFYFPFQYLGTNDYQSVFDNYKNDSDFLRSTDFFNNVIEPNFNTIKDKFINDIANFLKENEGTLTIILDGGIQNVSAIPAPYVKAQQTTAENYLKNNPSLKTFVENKKLIVRSLFTQYGSVTPKGSSNGGNTFDCFQKLSGTSEQIVLKGTACRRVLFQNFTFVPKTETTSPPDVNTIQSNDQLKPTDRTGTLEDLKSGISKKIIRNLLSECDYFDMIKENAPMVYDSLQEKIKYFSPTFHSMTPEGLNSRLTFLNQCVRPGETIPVIGLNGESIQNNALNTSFGAPPILVLRIGDFYHTKIVPTSLSFTYEPLHYDMNPEGIGIQPMIANVSLNFNIIGGMGIAKPVEQLQNALSFNFYANTEIYDERAVVTENRDKFDKELYDAIKNRVDSNPSPVESQTNSNGNTIGSILSTNVVEGGETGQIDYKNIMDSLLSTTQGYFETVVNQLESVQEKNNFGIVQILNYERQFNFGSVLQSPTFSQGNKEVIQIYGKPSNWESSIDNLVSRVLTSIDDNTNPIIVFLAKFFRVDNDSNPMRDVKINMKEYINTLANNFKLPISEQVQFLTKQQEVYVQTIRKLNVVVDKTDGKINDRNVPSVYNIAGTEYDKLVTDYGKLKEAMDRYVQLLSDGNNPIAFNEPTTEINLVNKNKFTTQAEVDFFVLMARKLTDKDDEQNFINAVIKNELTSTKNPVNLKNKFEKIVNDLQKIYSDELKDEKTLFDRLKKRQEFKNLTKGLAKIMYKPNVERKCTYTTVKNESIYAQQETLLSDLYSLVNVNEETNTFDGKINFK